MLGRILYTSAPPHTLTSTHGYLQNATHSDKIWPSFALLNPLNPRPSGANHEPHGTRVEKKMASHFSQKFESLGKMPRWPIFNKGGRPPKQWPSSGRRLLVRYTTAAYQNFTFIQRALEGSDFTVR